MNETEIKKIIDELIDPVRSGHLDMLEVNLKAIQDAFIKGMEIGKNLK